MLGYVIGAYLYNSVGHWLISLYGYGDKVEAFREAYARWGTLIILVKGVTPIPYKIVTITSGFAGYNLGLFIVFSFIARGMRFYLAAFLLNRFGARVRAGHRGAARLVGHDRRRGPVGGIIAALYVFWCALSTPRRTAQFHNFAMPRTSVDRPISHDRCAHRRGRK